MWRARFLITNGQCIHSMRRFGSAEQLRKTAESTMETGDPAYALALTEPEQAPIIIVPPPATPAKMARCISTGKNIYHRR